MRHFAIVREIMEINEIEDLLKDIEASIKALDIDGQKAERNELKKQTEQGGFWDDNQKASKIMQKIAALDENVTKWEQLKKDVDDLSELAKINDPKLESEINEQSNKLHKQFEKLKIELAYSGPYDQHNCVVSIHSGAGGTDAQDWAAMLLRMYIRWTEANNFKTNIFDESVGEEAGIKSVSFEVNGQLAYGKLKGEHGVHRLVRLSPFNAKNLRQTSFAKVEIFPEIEEPEEVPIDEKDLKIDVFRAGGHGGQSVNTTDSAVRVTHLPTGIVVSIQNERSQLQNKETALKILRSKLAQLQLEQHAEKVSDLKGPNQSAEWGNQIRSYVLHPYNMVKDLRTKHETSDTTAVLDGNLNDFIAAYAENSLKK